MKVSFSVDFIFLRDAREQTTRIEAQNIASREKALTYWGQHFTHSSFTLKILKELFLTTVQKYLWKRASGKEEALNLKTSRPRLSNLIVI